MKLGLCAQLSISKGQDSVLQSTSWSVVRGMVLPFKIRDFPLMSEVKNNSVSTFPSVKWEEQ